MGQGSQSFMPRQQSLGSPPSVFGKGMMPSYSRMGGPTGGASPIPQQPQYAQGQQTGGMSPVPQRQPEYSQMGPLNPGMNKPLSIGSPPSAFGMGEERYTQGQPMPGAPSLDMFSGMRQGAAGAYGEQGGMPPGMDGRMGAFNGMMQPGGAYSTDFRTTNQVGGAQGMPPPGSNPLFAQNYGSVAGFQMPGAMPSTAAVSTVNPAYQQGQQPSVAKSLGTPAAPGPQTMNTPWGNFSLSSMGPSYHPVGDPRGGYFQGGRYTPNVGNAMNGLDTLARFGLGWDGMGMGKIGA